MNKALNYRIRKRFAKRSIATQSEADVWSEIIDYKFADGIPEQFAFYLEVGDEKAKSAILELSELAAEYLRWIKVPQSSREIVKQQLLTLAAAKDGEAVLGILNELDKDTELRLELARSAVEESALSSIPSDWLTQNIDLELTNDVAASAARNLKGGDYSNLDLFCAISQLIEIYECYSEKAAKVGRFESELPLSNMAYLFFGRIEPQLERSTIWNTLDQEIRFRRKRAKR